MKLAIMSDSHDRWDHLERAVQLANAAGCEHLLFAGDLIAPPGLAVLAKFAGNVKFVWGNNEGERVKLSSLMAASPKIELCGDVFEGTIDGLRVFMNHYPRLAELAAKSGEFDVCIFGHTHEYQLSKVGSCVLINPGEIQGYITQQSGFVIFDTVSQKAEQVLIASN